MKTIKFFGKNFRGLAGKLVMLAVLLLVGGTSVGAYADVKPWVKYADGTLTFYYNDKNNLETDEYWLNEGKTTPGWNVQKDNITKVVFDESFKYARPMIGYQWFYKCSKLATIENISNLNTSEMTDMSAMFYYCNKLTSLDVSNFDTKNVTDMSAMFGYCYSLTSLDVSKFNTAKVKDMSSMFYSCTALTSLDVSNFDTKDVTNMSYMFNTCYTLTSLDVSKFNTAKVTNMSYMFGNCKKLQSLDVSGFNTAKVTKMTSMFYTCSALTSLDVSDFNTEDVTNMKYMFYSCDKLQSLNLSNFNTAKVTNMSYMFQYSPALTTIYVSDKFTTDGVEGDNSNDMFSGCTSLVGYAQCDGKTNTNKEYANYTTGYFTKMVGTLGTSILGATGKSLTLTGDLTLSDDADLVLNESVKSKAIFYSRTVPSTWGTLCVPFALTQSTDNNWTFYRLTGINDAKNSITLESFEEGEIPAGTPVLFKMKEGQTALELSANNATIVAEPVAANNPDVNLVGTFAKIGGEGNHGLEGTDYIIGKNKFWRVSELTANEGSKGVGVKPMRAYIRATDKASSSAAMLSIGIGDDTTAIDHLNAISSDADAEYYDMQGRRTNGLQKGLNIVKRGNQTYKIIIK